VPAARDQSSLRDVPPRSLTPLHTLDTNDIANASSLTAARRSLHYPIARAARAIQLAPDRPAQYEAVLDAAEALTVTLGISATAWLCATGKSVPSITDMYGAFLRGGVSQGRWLAVLNDARPIVARDDGVDGLAKALQRRKGGAGLPADLEVLLQERNRWAHGARPRTAVEAGLRVLEIGPALEDALESALPFASAPWLLTQSSSFQRKGTFSVSALRVMGDHPEFERTRFESGAPLLDETFYLMTALGPIDLTPLVVMRYCNTCHRPEVCYADRIDNRHGVALKGFASGHVIFDSTLVGDVQALLGSSEPPSSAQS
jgi:hypothetical protein